MNCGSCGQPMIVSVERGVELDRCTTCSTVFFDGGELSAWEDETTERLAFRVMALAAGSKVRGPACPRCNNTTREVFEKTLAADVCQSCNGVLLRRLEVDDMARPRHGSGVDEDVAEAAIWVAGDVVLDGATDGLETTGQALEAASAGTDLLGSVAEGVGDLLSSLLEGLSGIDV